MSMLITELASVAESTNSADSTGGAGSAGGAALYAGLAVGLVGALVLVVGGVVLWRGLRGEGRGGRRGQEGARYSRAGVGGGAGCGGTCSSGCPSPDQTPAALLAPDVTQHDYHHYDVPHLADWSVTSYTFIVLNVVIIVMRHVPDTYLYLSHRVSRMCLLQLLLSGRRCSARGVRRASGERGGVLLGLQWTVLL